MHIDSFLSWLSLRLPHCWVNDFSWKHMEGGKPVKHHNLVSAPLWVTTGWLAPARTGVGSGKESINVLVLAGESPGVYTLPRSTVELAATQTSVQGNYITSREEKGGKFSIFLNVSFSHVSIFKVSKLSSQKRSVGHLIYYQHLLNCPPVYNHSQRRCANLP